MDLNSSLCNERARYSKIRACASVRTWMAPYGTPPRVHEYGKHCPGASRPSRCKRRTSIEVQDSQVVRPPSTVCDFLHLGNGGYSTLGLSLQSITLHNGGL